MKVWRREYGYECVSCGEWIQVFQEASSLVGWPVMPPRCWNCGEQAHVELPAWRLVVVDDSLD